MGRSRVGAAGAAALGKALATNKTLAALNLLVNGVGGAGAVSLGKALETNMTLALFLSSNGVGVAGEKALAVAQGKRRVVALMSKVDREGVESSARRLIEGDGDRAIATRVLGFLVGEVRARGR